jgi:hypothetical protein
LYRFDVISAFLDAKNGGKTISAARGHVRPEVKSPFDSLTQFGIGRLWNFSAIFYLSNVIQLFRFACKIPFEIFGKGHYPMKKFFIDETQKTLLWVNPHGLGHRACKWV